MIIENVFRNIIGREKFTEVELYLDKENITFARFEFLILIAAMTILTILSLLFLFYIINVYIYVIGIVLTLPTCIALGYIYILYKEELRQRAIETELSDFLLQASLFPKNSDIVAILEFVTKQNKGYLSKEFQICLDQIKKGFKTEIALRDIIARNKSVELKRAINILISGYKSGADLSEVLHKLSQEIITTQAITQERYSSLSIQKYTLLASAGFLVPFVFGMVKDLVLKIDLSMFAEEGLFAIDHQFIEYANYAIYIYLFEFAVISSIFIAIIDGDWKKFILYSAILIPLSYLVFII